ncbi:hypothetical protein LP420_40330 [Massilia sp. B-10]|nr:hypothetical protein LP420_40330 [Massilia sp. B-10]
MLNASATNSINVTETVGTLYVGTVSAATGNVILSVRDNAAADDNLVMEAFASIAAPSVVPGNGSILLQAERQHAHVCRAPS